MTATTIEPLRRNVARNPEFKRDKQTWQSYLLYGYWSYVWGLFGPLMPFMRNELKLDYATAAYHFSALALGPLMAGLVGYRIISYVGPPRVVWIGLSMIVAGVLAVLFGPNQYLTIFGAWLIGFGGSHLGQVVIASLADRFQAMRSRSIAEINITGSTFTALAPLTVAAGINLHWPWKTCLVLSMPLLAAILLGTRGGKDASWHIAELSPTDTRKLPRSYWLYFTIVFLSVAGEWSIAFWSPEYLEKVVHFSQPTACAGLSVFLISMLAGRVLGGKLAAMMAPHRLLSCAAVTATIGFFTFWLGRTPVIALGGLALLGLGEANVYPMALSSAIGAAKGLTTQATAKMSLSTGSAILLAPLVLGIVADKAGLFDSYGLIGALFTVAAIAAIGIEIVSSNSP
jgi:fucose permease